MNDTDVAIQRRRTPIIRPISEATLGEAMDARFIGLDDDAEHDGQWWEIKTADDLDAAIHPLALAMMDAARAKAYYAEIEKTQSARITKLLDKYGHLIKAEVPVDIHKSHKFYKGEHTKHLGQYTHNPGKTSLKLADGPEAVKHELATVKTVASLDTQAARDYMSIHGRDALEAAGVQVTDEPAVTFKVKS